MGRSCVEAGLHMANPIFCRSPGLKRFKFDTAVLCGNWMAVLIVSKGKA